MPYKTHEPPCGGLEILLPSIGDGVEVMFVDDVSSMVDSTPFSCTALVRSLLPVENILSMLLLVRMLLPKENMVCMSPSCPCRCIPYGLLCS